MNRSHSEEMRRYLLAREAKLLAQLPEMSEEELRWTVRLFGDCLNDAARTLSLWDYSEYLPLEQMRASIASFIPQYTKLALQDLEAKAAGGGEGLASFTDEELQSMSCAEKWRFLLKDQEAISPSQLRRELARLLFCRTLNLYFDPSLPLAAIEYPAYFEVQEALAALPAEALEALKQETLSRIEQLEQGPSEKRQEAFDALRGKLAQAAGVKSLDALFEGRMEKIPRGGHRPAEEPPPLYLEDLSREELQTSLRVLADLMSLEEFRRELLPLKERYPSFSDLPEEELKRLIRTLAFKMGDRTILDYTARYRFGRMLTQRSLSPHVWALLPQEEKLRLLLQDSERMDIAQAARHLSRIFLSDCYERLYDVGAQLRLLDEPSYQALQDRLIFETGRPPHAERLQGLNRTVTRMMWEVENAGPEGREGRFLEVRKVIAAAIGLNLAKRSKGKSVHGER